LSQRERGGEANKIDTIGQFPEKRRGRGGSDYDTWDEWSVPGENREGGTNGEALIPTQRKKKGNVGREAESDQ